MGLRYALPVMCVAWVLAAMDFAAPQAAQVPRAPADSHAGPMFQTSHDCLACHNGLTTSTGEDVSIGSSWRASIMANASRDPYWQASVRREMIDHPAARAEIEDECAICHMPMSRAQAVTSGGRGEIFAHLPIGRGEAAADALAADGVSCSLCHQIRDDKLGTRESFTGGFVLDRAPSAGPRSIFGPFEIDQGRTTIMRSATGFKPTEASHVRQSELCATCHTLYTTALGPGGKAIGELPEQVPYLEWRHSAFREERSCQSCHMPTVREKMPITSVLGEPREGLARHSFVGGNFFMLRMLNRYRVELGVEALPVELDAAARRTVQFLQSETAEIAVESARVSTGRLEFDIDVKNLAGHKLPSAYPSRRVWLHVSVRDATGQTIFESGAVGLNGRIEGNDHDVDPFVYEPHYMEIRRPQEVQIYESIMAGADGRPTTGLLTAVQFIKDNRLLPRGFDKATAEADIAVRGDAARDTNFAANGDRVRYSIDLATRSGPFEVQAELFYQPISFRWAQNLRSYEAPETKRFVTYFESMSAGTAEVLARSTRSVP
ncbi:MAG: hypothetical protein EHM89_06875 [Acidobacteria bacterium]|nr:MAG: hypothetical protein EHM89_06875 [Acidobacteriota bacterium]